MAYHYNGKEVNKCTAQPGNCPFGGAEVHFETKKEAEAYRQEILEIQNSIISLQENSPNVDKLSNFTNSLSTDELHKAVCYTRKDEHGTILKNLEKNNDSNVAKLNGKFNGYDNPTIKGAKCLKNDEYITIDENRNAFTLNEDKARDIMLSHIQHTLSHAERNNRLDSTLRSSGLSDSYYKSNNRPTTPKTDLAGTKNKNITAIYSDPSGTLKKLDNPTRTECLLAVRRNGNSIKDVPVEKRDYEICLSATENGDDTIDFIPEKHRTNEIVELALKKNPQQINMLSQNQQTKERVMAAIKAEPLCFIGLKNKTKEICDYAVSVDSENAQFVPKEFR